MIPSREGMSDGRRRPLPVGRAPHLRGRNPLCQARIGCTGPLSGVHAAGAARLRRFDTSQPLFFIYNMTERGGSMKTAVFASCLCILLAFGGCRQTGPADDQVAKKVQALESKLDALQKQTDDLKLKNEISSSLLFRSPLDDFFNSPEFWERTYDSGKADCAKRCIKELQTARAACMTRPEGQRLQCFQEATDRAAACQKGCSGL